MGSTHIVDVIPSGAGFLAVGYVVENGQTNGAIWSSPDGTTWQKVDAATPQVAFISVVALGSTFVAVSGACQNSECLAPESSWTSSDGKNWTKHAMDECCVFNDLAVGSGMVIAIGADTSTGFPQNPADVAAFSSSDGAKWTRATGDASFKAASMGAAAWDGSGFASLGNGQSSMVAWTSQNGSAWTPAPTSDALATAEVKGMVLLGTTLVGVGRNSNGAVSWTSADGQTWKRSSSSAATDNGVMNSVAVNGSQLVAVGHDGTGTAAIWTSTDGLNWSPVAGVPGGAAQLTAVAANDGHVVAFGSSTTGAAVLLVGF